MTAKKTKTPARKAPAPEAAGDRDDARIVRHLAALLAETDLTEIEIERVGLRVRVSRAASASPAAAPPQATPLVHAPAPPPGSAPKLAHAHGELANHPGAVHSPMVGTVYVSPSPGAPSFVKVGDGVTEGQTLLIVEAMKTMNPIAAPRSGRVTRILIADAQPVEYGEVLMIIE